LEGLAANMLKGAVFLKIKDSTKMM